MSPCRFYGFRAIILKGIKYASARRVTVTGHWQRLVSTQHASVPAILMPSRCREMLFQGLMRFGLEISFRSVGKHFQLDRFLNFLSVMGIRSRVSDVTVCTCQNQKRDK